MYNIYTYRSLNLGEPCSRSPRINSSVEGPVCLGQAVSLQCTYPILQECGHLPTILWQRNGMDIHPHPKSSETVTFHNWTTAVLVTTYNDSVKYRCYFHDGEMAHLSNEVAVDYIRKATT